MYYRVITPSVIMPIDATFVKTKLRMTHAALDTDITSLIAAATSQANDFTGRQLNAAILMACSPILKDGIYHLEKGPVNDVSKIEYVKIDDTSAEIPSTEYKIIPRDLDMFVIIDTGYAFSDADTLRPDTIRITYAAGCTIFADDIKNAVALMVGRMLMNPEDGVDEKVSISENLLRRYKCPIV